MHKIGYPSTCSFVQTQKRLRCMEMINSLFFHFKKLFLSGKKKTPHEHAPASSLSTACVDSAWEVLGSLKFFCILDFSHDTRPESRDEGHEEEFDPHTTE